RCRSACSEMQRERAEQWDPAAAGAGLPKQTWDFSVRMMGAQRLALGRFGGALADRDSSFFRERDSPELQGCMNAFWQFGQSVELASDTRRRRIEHPARRQLHWLSAFGNTWLYQYAKGALAHCPPSRAVAGKNHS